MSADVICVHGDASAAELAVLIAALRARVERGAVAEHGYQRWRRTRLAALREHGAADRRRTQPRPKE